MPYVVILFARMSDVGHLFFGVAVSEDLCIFR